MISDFILLPMVILLISVKKLMQYGTSNITVLFLAKIILIYSKTNTDVKHNVVYYNFDWIIIMALINKVLLKVYEMNRA